MDGSEPKAMSVRKDLKDTKTLEFYLQVPGKPKGTAAHSSDRPT